MRFMTGTWFEIGNFGLVCRAMEKWNVNIRVSRR
jgi:hypothetical protein